MKNHSKSSIPFGGGDSTDSAPIQPVINGKSLTNGKAAANGNGVASIVHANANGHLANGNGNGHHHAKATNGNGEAYLNGNGTKHGKTYYLKKLNCLKWWVNKYTGNICNAHL